MLYLIPTHDTYTYIYIYNCMKDIDLIYDKMVVNHKFSKDCQPDPIGGILQGQTPRFLQPDGSITS